MGKANYRLGVDIGGTFTDVVLMRRDGTIFSKKVLSTPQDYSVGIETGISALLGELGINAGDIGEFVHATTVATNTIIERKGAKAALITTKGFRDVLEIGRFRTPRLYDIHYRKPDPLIERRLRFEIDERIGSDGTIVTPLSEADLAAAVDRLAAESVDAVSVTFVNSYVNPAHERQAADFIAARMPGVPVTASIDLLPQLGEYERTSTTVVNSYIRPVVERYVSSLKTRLDRLGIRAPLMIMQSSGGISPGEVVARRPIDIIESGPAAGVLGGQRLGLALEVPDMLVFDMGGTTAKATVIEQHAFGLCPETEVGGGAALGARMIKGAGYPVQVPTIDIAEVGAGGGSIAASDAAGGLTVGPRSAGAEPGPVAYRRGGTDPTVTDANLLLGYLNPKALVSGELTLDIEKARAAMNTLGERIGLDVTQTAHGIHAIADATMLRALRGVSSEKGRDPSQYTMLAIGGNGAVHACSLAQIAGMKRIVVPPVAGLFSALGMLFADVEHQLVAAFYRRFEDADDATLDAAIAPLVRQCKELLASEGFETAEKQRMSVYADLRYVGQTAPLTLPLPEGKDRLERLKAEFHEAHHDVFGYDSPKEAIQFVSLKLVGQGVPDTPRMPERIERGAEKRIGESSREAYFETTGWVETPIVPRSSLSVTPQAGPLIVEEYDTTIVVLPGWSAAKDDRNNVLLVRQSEAA